eukprot:1783440-Pleurochrysis_carterae.AAC.1
MQQPSGMGQTIQPRREAEWNVRRATAMHSRQENVSLQRGPERRGATNHKLSRAAAALHTRYCHAIFALTSRVEPHDGQSKADS